MTRRVNGAARAANALANSVQPPSLHQEQDIIHIANCRLSGSLIRR